MSTGNQPLSPNASAFRPSSDPNPKDPAEFEFPPPGVSEPKFASALDTSTFDLLKDSLLAVIEAKLSDVRSEFASQANSPVTGAAVSGVTGKAKLGQLSQGNSSQAGTSTDILREPVASKDLLSQVASLVATAPKSNRFEEASFLDVHEFISLIEDGFRILPPVGPNRPHRFSIEGDQTYQRIYEKYKDKIKNPLDNGSLQEYHALFCSTLYISCSVAALSAVCAEGFTDLTDEVVCISRGQAELICSVTKTLAEIESQARARFAHIRIKHDPLQDSAFQRIVAEEVNQTELSSQGSSDITRLLREYQLLRSSAIAKEGSKVGAAALFKVKTDNKNKDKKKKNSGKDSKSEDG